MEDLLRELEEAAGEWPENHRLAKACRKGALEINRLRDALEKCEAAKEDYRDAMVVFDRDAKEAKAEAERLKARLECVEKAWDHSSRMNAKRQGEIDQLCREMESLKASCVPVQPPPRPL